MSYYRKCPYCGANNDPGESCVCGGLISVIRNDTALQVLTLNCSDNKKSHTPLPAAETGAKKYRIHLVSEVPLTVY